MERGRPPSVGLSHHNTWRRDEICCSCAKHRIDTCCVICFLDSSEAHSSRSSTPVPINGGERASTQHSTHSHSRSGSPSHSRRTTDSNNLSTSKDELASIVADTKENSSAHHGRSGSNGSSRSYGSTDSTGNTGGANLPSVEPKRLSSASESDDAELLRRQKRQWMYILPMICIGMFGIMTSTST